ncbi:hypothetical protein [Devosia sp. CAU 1758]
MRVPKAGQALDERRIVREGKRLAEAMLAGYSDPPSLTLPGLMIWAALMRQQLRGALNNRPVRY